MIKTGEYIDGSLYNDFELNLKIIELAESFGFEHKERIGGWDIAGELADEAIDFLNEKLCDENFDLVSQGFSWGFNNNWPGSFGIWEDD